MANVTVEVWETEIFVEDENGKPTGKKKQGFTWAIELKSGAMIQPNQQKLSASFKKASRDAQNTIYNIKQDLRADVDFVPRYPDLAVSE